MASEKERMLSAAYSYAGAVAAAKTACDEACANLNAAREEINSNWNGEAANAMYSALTNWQAEVTKLSGKLSSIQAQMTSHAKSIYNSWPEEESEQ